MSKRKAEEEVKPLDGGQPPPEKKAKKEVKYADQIEIKYEPANSAFRDTALASYYALKIHCEHGFFESDKIPDPPEMKITSRIPHSSLPAFIDAAMGIDISPLTVTVRSGRCYARDEQGVSIDGVSAACNALAVLPLAIYFQHVQMATALRAIVLDVATETAVYENERLFSDDPVTCMKALLQLTQQMGHGKDYCDLLGVLAASNEVKGYIRDPKMTARFGQVFRAIQMTDWANAPAEIRDYHACPFCNEGVTLWSRGEYAQMILGSGEKTPDWKAIREAKIESIKSCKDHHSD